MATATVKWFTSTKGIGFILPDTCGRDVSAVEKVSGLNEGTKVSYEVVANRGKG
ncbi:MAG: cold shock domain-containing protein, partial [Bradyrhizobium sp.]